MAFGNELRHEKTNNAVSEQVRHKLVCTVTEGGSKLEILYLERSDNKGADQLRSYWFSRGAAHMSHHMVQRNLHRSGHVPEGHYIAAPLL